MNWQNAKLVKDSPAESLREIPLGPGKGNMSRYTSAVERFHNSASQFIQHLHYLTQARDAYQKAITASAKLRVALNAGDETLRLLMTNMEQALHFSIRKPTLDEKESDTADEEPFKPVGEDASAKKGFL
jgi:hypothetical protein